MTIKGTTPNGYYIHFADTVEKHLKIYYYIFVVQHKTCKCVTIYVIFSFLKLDA